MRRRTRQEAGDGPDSTRLDRRRLLSAVGAAGVTAIAGCAQNLGKRSTDTPGTDAASSLVERARAEGTVTLYSVIDTPALEDTIIPAFTEDYSWADVEIVGLGPSQIASRMSSEYQSNQVRADLAWNTQSSMTPLASQGVFRRTTDVPEIQTTFRTNDYPDYLHADFWAPGIQNPQSVIYNTEALSAAAVPDSYEAWANSRWKDRLVFDHPHILNVAGGEFASLYGSMDEGEWTTLMEGIAANGPTLTQSASEAFRRVAQGEAAMGVGLINNYIVGQQKDSPPPVELKWVSPDVSLNVPLYLAKGAPHPAMAVLFTTWLMSPSGQVAAAETGNTPTQPHLAKATFDQYIPSDVKLRPVAHDVPSYFEEPQSWIDRFGSIFD